MIENAFMVTLLRDVTMPPRTNLRRKCGMLTWHDVACSHREQCSREQGEHESARFLLQAKGTKRLTRMC